MRHQQLRCGDRTHHWDRRVRGGVQGKIDPREADDPGCGEEVEILIHRFGQNQLPP
uniref:Uncharacterized protein n=1 Tax=Ciona savignyi TaxID=51511 RepID=H2YTU7_CIOSA